MRSGEYKQIEGTLRDTHTGENTLRYCCLGVLCELHRAEEKIEDGWQGSHYLGAGGFPSKVVTQWADLSSRGGSELARMNDAWKLLGPVLMHKPHDN